MAETDETPVVQLTIEQWATYLDIALWSLRWNVSDGDEYDELKRGAIIISSARRKLWTTEAQELLS